METPVQAGDFAIITLAAHELCSMISSHNDAVITFLSGLGVRAGSTRSLAAGAQAFQFHEGGQLRVDVHGGSVMIMQTGSPNAPSSTVWQWSDTYKRWVLIDPDGQVWVGVPPPEGGNE